MKKEDKKIDSRYVDALHDKLSTPVSWMLKANCLELDNAGDIFNEETMMPLCSQCPVKNTCFKWAKNNGVSAGIFGGRHLSGEK